MVLSFFLLVWWCKGKYPVLLEIRVHIYFYLCWKYKSRKISRTYHEEDMYYQISIWSIVGWASTDPFCSGSKCFYSYISPGSNRMFLACLSIWGKQARRSTTNYQGKEAVRSTDAQLSSWRKVHIIIAVVQKRIVGCGRQEKLDNCFRPHYSKFRSD